MRVAAYIAGDKGIVKSSIVVFKSLIKFHPEIDKFLFLSDINIEESDKMELLKLNIKLEMIEDNLFQNSISWPKECFLNFKVPNILKGMGYDVALKFDYDVLVNGSLDIEENIPKDEMFTLMNHNYETLRDMVKNDYEFFEKEFKISQWSKKIGMFGNIYINLKKYTEEKFWEKYSFEYKNILENSPNKSPNSFFADMGLFALVLEKYEYSYKVMKEKYNCCASIRHLVNFEELDLNPRFIHYSGPKKPWKKLGIKLLTNPYYSYLRQIWINFVMEETEFNWNLERENKKINLLESKIIKSEFYKRYLKIIVKKKMGD